MEGTYREIQTALQQKNVQLVAVSKTRPPEAVMEMYQAGHRDFGENRVQELREKYDALPKDIRWHLIGHLQTNKVKYIAPWIYMIHSVDSAELLEEIDKQGRKNNRVIPCLLQVYIADEETKFGMEEEELTDLIASGWIGLLQNVRIDGLMGMATNTENMEQVRMEFRHLKEIFTRIKKHYYPNEPTFRHISMGMSHDYTIAIEEGSTIVRIGSLLFGERN